MLPEMLFGSGRVELGGSSWVIREERLGNLISASGLVYFTDALERVRAEEIEDVPHFQFATETAGLPVGVVWLRRDSNTTDQRLAALVLGNRPPATGCPDETWHLAEQSVFSQGTALLGAVAECLDDLVDLQGNPQRLVDLVKGISSTGPKCFGGLVAVAGPDGPLECWIAAEPGPGISCLVVDLDAMSV